MVSSNVVDVVIKNLRQEGYTSSDIEVLTENVRKGRETATNAFSEAVRRAREIVRSERKQKEGE